MIKWYKRWFSFLLFSYIEEPGGGDPAGGDPDPAAGGDPSDPSGDPSGAGGDPAGEPVAAWNENWRETIADGDDKVLAQLGRYSTPTDIWNKARSLEQRLSSGELRSTDPFPEKGSDKEKASWRDENGVPQEAKYDLSMPEGFVIGEADQPVIDGFMEYAHEKNMSTQTVSDSVNWYFQNQESMAEARNDTDSEYQTTNTDELRTEWGDQYRPNINRINGLLDTAPEEVKEAIMGSRLPDGNPLGSNAGVLRYLAQLAHEINPVTTLVPGSGANVMNAIGDEISAIEKVMHDDRKAYNKDEKMQARYRDLLEARDKHKAA